MLFMFLYAHTLKQNLYKVTHTHISMKRELAIKKITATIKALHEKGLSYDFDKLLLEVMSEFFVARRTAIEYIKTAEFSANGMG